MAISTSTLIIVADMPDRAWTIVSGQVELTTRRLVLKPVNPNDAHELSDLADDWLVARETPSMPYPYNLETAQSWISDAIGARRRGTDYIFVIRDMQDQCFLGAVGLQIDGTVAEVGYWVGRPFWSKGYATEAVGAVLEFARSQLNITGFRAKVFADNSPSARVLAKLGFQLSHEEHQFFSNRGGFRRIMCFGLGHGDVWPERSTAWRRLVSAIRGLWSATGFAAPGRL